MVLIISGVLLIISYCIIIFSDKIDNKFRIINNSSIGVGIIGLIVSLFFGFAVSGTTIPVKTERTQIKSYEFIEGKYHYALDMSDKLITIDNGKIINALLNDKNVSLFKVIKFNSYNRELSHEYIVEPKIKE